MVTRSVPRSVPHLGCAGLPLVPLLDGSMSCRISRANYARSARSSWRRRRRRGRTLRRVRPGFRAGAGCSGRPGRRSARLGSLPAVARIAFPSLRGAVPTRFASRSVHSRRPGFHPQILLTRLRTFWRGRSHGHEGRYSPLSALISAAIFAHAGGTVVMPSATIDAHTAGYGVTHRCHQFTCR